MVEKSFSRAHITHPSLCDTLRGRQWLENRRRWQADDMVERSENHNQRCGLRRRI